MVSKKGFINYGKDKRLKGYMKKNTVDYKKYFYRLLAVTVLVSVMLAVVWIHGGYTGKTLNKLGFRISKGAEYAVSGLLTTSITCGSEAEDKVLVLGNSITIHQVCDFWWEDRGMASTECSRDYVHVLENMLSEQYKADVAVVNYSQWETMWYDRSETFPLI